MRVCIVTNGYPPNVVSGPGRYAYNLTNKLNERGHDVTVVTTRLKGGKRYERVVDKKSGITKIYRLDLPKSLLNFLDLRFSANQVFKKFFRNHNHLHYDLIHIIDVNAAYFIDRSLAKKIPIIVSINDYYSLETSLNIFRFPYFCTDIVQRFVHYNIQKNLIIRALRLASMIIGDTKYVVKTVKRIANISEKKVTHIYKGVDTEKFSGEVSHEKYRNHIMLYVGGNMERKGARYIVEAMPLILRKYSHAKLIMIGKPSKFYQKLINRIIKKYNIANSVHQITFCDPLKIPEQYAKANVFVMTPLIEDMAQVYLEAMATKTPVIATDVGANSECTVDKKTGFLIKPKSPKQIADAVLRIFDNPSLAEEMGKNGYESIKKIFNAQRMFDETMSTYKKVVKEWKKK